jgi:hypothetical protein
VKLPIYWLKAIIMTDYSKADEKQENMKLT